MKRVSLLGPGTFTEESAHYFLGKDGFEYVNCKLIADVFRATVDGTTDFSVIPIENTFEGSVSLHVDWLVHDVDLRFKRNGYTRYPLICFPFLLWRMSLTHSRRAAAGSAKSIHTV